MQRTIRLIFCVAMFGGLFFLTVRSTAPADWAKKTLRHSSLGVNSGLLGADISPDDRFVAIYTVNSKDLADRRKDEAIYEIQIWNWRSGKLISRKVLFRESPIKLLGIQPCFVHYADAGAKLVVYQEGHLLVLNSSTLVQIQDIDMQMAQFALVRYQCSK